MVSYSVHSFSKCNSVRIVVQKPYVGLLGVCSRSKFFAALCVSSGLITKYSAHENFLTIL